MVGIGFFRKKSNKEKELKLDDSLIREGKLDLPPPPSPTNTGGLDMLDYPPYSVEQEKIVLPPLEEEKPELPPVGNLNSLDQSWTEFLKQNSEMGEEISQAIPGVEITQPEAEPEIEQFKVDEEEPVGQPQTIDEAGQAGEEIELEDSDISDIERAEAPETPAEQPKPAAARVEQRFEARKPIFIEVGTYSGFLEEIGRIRMKLQLAVGVIARIDALREKEEIELRKWHQGMDEMRRKFLFIDDALFGG